MKIRDYRTKTISKTLATVFVVLAGVFVLFGLGPDGRAFAEGEVAPSSTNFYNSSYYYNQLKQQIESKPARLTYDAFDENIDCTKAALGLGINFGNELDWNYGSDNDRPTRQRRYELLVDVGYRDGSTYTPYYTYEYPFNATGNLFTYENMPDVRNGGHGYASVALKQVNQSLTADSAINYIRVRVRNSYNKAWGQEVGLDVKKFELYSNSGDQVLARNGASWAATPASASPVMSYQTALDATHGEFFGADTELRLSIQLQNFVSDYKDRPGLVYEHTASYNNKLTYSGSGESATVDIEALDETLMFLKENGIKTIRLPITWYCHMDSTGTVDPEWFAEVNKVVRRLIGQGFYVIVNIHGDTGRKGWIKADEALFNGYTAQDGTVYPGYRDTYRYLCLQIAENFKRFDHHLIIQGPNEVLNYKNYETYRASPIGASGPITPAEYSVMNELNQIFVDEVRRTGYNNKNRFLLCNTYYSGRMNLPYFRMPSEPKFSIPGGSQSEKVGAVDKIFVGLHDYTIGTGEDNNGLLSSLGWLGNTETGGGYRYIDPNGSSKYRILLDEFGILNTESLEKRNTLMNVSVPKGYELGIPMMFWDDGGAFAIVEKSKANNDPSKWEWHLATQSDEPAEIMISKYRENALPEHIWETDKDKFEYTWTPEVGAPTKVTASRGCVRGCGHAQSETANVTAQRTKDPTCTEAGETTYSASFVNEQGEGFEPQTKTLADVSMLEHAWGTRSYEWSSDNSSCTAKVTCTRMAGAPHEETETAEATSQQTKAPTCTEAGETTYSALFKNEKGEGFEAQTKTLPDVPALGHDWGEVTYTWEDDNMGVVGQRKCKTCERSQVIRVPANAEVTKQPTCTQAGETTYTSGDFGLEGFEVQTKTASNVPALGHSWGAWTVTKAATVSAEGVETRYCSHDAAHRETRAIAKKAAPTPVPTPEPGSDPKQMGSDGTAFGPGASAAAVEKAIAAMKSDGDPAGSRYAPLMLKSTKQTKTSVKLAWQKVSGARAYVVYGNKCGKSNKMKKLATLGAGKKTVTVKKIAAAGDSGSGVAGGAGAASVKVKKGTYYKFMVVALDKNNNVVSSSKVVHVATKGSAKRSNPTGVTVKAKVNKSGKALKKWTAAKQITLKAGAKPKSLLKATGLKGAITKAKKTKVANHRKVSFESSNTKIATVTAAGKVKAKKKGDCYIYVYAQNGISKRIKVRVK